jgi:REP element-mobilizing transposase RayT
MDDYESLNNTNWECKYHVVFIPKCRRRVTNCLKQAFENRVVSIAIH